MNDTYVRRTAPSPSKACGVGVGGGQYRDLLEPWAQPGRDGGFSDSAVQDADGGDADLHTGGETAWAQRSGVWRACAPALPLPASCTSLARRELTMAISDIAKRPFNRMMREREENIGQHVDESSGALTRPFAESCSRRRYTD